MKKIAITICALTLAMGAFAQKKNVNGAEAKLYEPVDLDGARTQIEAAMTNPETSNWSKTYYIAGQVYYKIYEGEENKKLTNKSYDQDLEDECLSKSVETYLKAGELDVLPNEKGQVKPKYLKDIKKNVKQYSNYLINAGLARYNAKEYDKAIDLWGKYISACDHSVMSGEPKDTLYNEIKYYNVLACANAKGKEDLQIKYMTELKNANYKAEDMCQWLVGAYQKKGDNANMIATLKDGVSKYPSNNYLMGTLINYYLDNNKEAEAIAYLDEAISKEPKNVQYYNIKTQLYLKKENFEEAIKVSKQAIAVVPQDFTANYMCGIAHVKKTEAAIDKAGKIKDNAKYNAEMKKAKATFNDAVPYLEAARKIDPKDKTNLSFLKTCYYRTNNPKWQQIEKEINALP